MFLLLHGNIKLLVSLTDVVFTLKIEMVGNNVVSLVNCYVSPVSTDCWFPSGSP